MRIFYIANFKDIHSDKWVRFFEQEGHAVFRFHVNGFLSELLRAKKEISTFKPQIVHIHYAGKNGLMGALTGFHPLIVTIHGSEVLLVKEWRRRFVRWVLKKADTITTDGNHVLDKITGPWKISADKVKIINFGVDVDKFRRPEGFEVPVNVVAVRVGPDKLYDIETVEKAREIVDAKMPGIEWRFLDGIAPEDMPEALYSSTVYVSAATSDAGLASTTAEAMSCEVPVIVTNGGDNARWVEESVNGFLFHPGDYQTLANRILFTLRDGVIQRCYGERSRKLICDKNNYFAEMAKMQTIYKEVIDRGKETKS